MISFVETLPSTRLRRALAIAALAVSILTLAVFVRRAHAAFTAASVAPGTTVTTGFEEESLYAVWRAAHGQSVYTDQTRLPYTVAYFNWLFYASYSLPFRVHLLPLDGITLTQAARLLSAAAALVGATALTFALARRLRLPLAVAAALGSFIFLGPLVSWWAHTVRPDICALVTETLGLLAVLLWFRSRPLLAVTFGALCFYAAWAFKPTFVFGFLSAAAFLLWRRQWRVLLGLGCVLGLAVVGSLAVLVEYRRALQNTAASSVYYLQLGWMNASNGLIKLLPLAIAALLCVFTRRNSPDETPLAIEARTLGIVGLLVTFPLSFIASCKLGAAPNYFLSLGPLAALALAGLLASRPVAVLPVCALLGGIGALQAATLLGRVGQLDLEAQSAPLARRWELHRRLPEPRFSSDLRLNLPWVSPGSPPLILAYNYPLDRHAGMKFEHGGVGGLIERGYFASLLLASHYTEFDQASLRGYRRVADSEGLTAYVRIDLADPR